MLLAQFTWMNVFVPCDNCEAHDLIFYFFKKKNRRPKKLVDRNTGGNKH